MSKLAPMYCIFFSANHLLAGREFHTQMPPGSFASFLQRFCMCAASCKLAGEERQSINLHAKKSCTTVCKITQSCCVAGKLWILIAIYVNCKVCELHHADVTAGKKSRENVLNIPVNLGDMAAKERLLEQYSYL